MSDKYTWFTAVLYPHEDTKHGAILKYLTESGLFKSLAWIDHDKDVWGDEAELPDGVNVGDSKKSHTHVLFRYYKSIAPAGACKALLGVHVEGVNDECALYTYLTHTDLVSRMAGKHEYDASEVHNVKGMDKVVRLTIAQDSNYAQFKEMVNTLQSHDGCLVDFINSYSDMDDDQYTVLRQMQGLLSTVSAQCRTDSRNTALESLREIKHTHDELVYECEAYKRHIDALKKAWGFNSPYEYQVMKHRYIPCDDIEGDLK